MPLCCAPSSFYSARAPTPSPKTHDPEPITPGKLCKQDGVHWLLVATGVKVACVHGLAQTAGRNVLAEHAARRSGKRPPQTPARAGRKCTVQALRGHQSSAKMFSRPVARVRKVPAGSVTNWPCAIASRFGDSPRAQPAVGVAESRQQGASTEPTSEFAYCA